MKVRHKFLIALLIAAMAVITTPQALRRFDCLRAALGDRAKLEWTGVLATVYAQEREYDEKDLPEREEMRQSYQLAPGASVTVSGINGAVSVETSNTSTAEVYVVRSARSREDLEHRKVIIENTPAGLVVRGEQERFHPWHGDVRQRVMLKLPRQVDLTAKGVNGHVTVGEVDGPVKLSGINGRVEVAQATGYSEISGINGRVVMTIAHLGERGIHVSGINGGIELRFAEGLNADLSVTGINGDVDTELPNVTVQGRVSRSNFHARIGSGGAPITVSGVNGHVHLAPRA